MNDAEAIQIGREALLLVLSVSAPVMATALGVGLLIALFQALTQLQEMTLVFVPKIVVVFLVLGLSLPFMLASLTTFVETLADRIIGLG